MNKKVYEKIKQEIIEKGIADGGLVGVGTINNVSKWSFLTVFLGFTMQNRSDCDYAFSVMGDSLIVVPYKQKTLFYQDGSSIKKENIALAKVQANSFFFKTVDGKKKRFQILKGKDDFKGIVAALGFEKNKTQK